MGTDAPMSEKNLVGALNGELDHSLALKFTVGIASAGTAVAVLSVGERFVNVIDNDGSYLLSFNWKERQQAHGQTSDISHVADAARRWVEGSGLEDLAADHPFIKFSGLQLAYERGTAAEYQWAALLASVEEEDHIFRGLVLLASRDSVLNRFSPRLGHRFALSVDEYSDGILVAVFVRRPGRFVIFGDDDGVEFEGDAAQMVDYLVARLRDRVPR